MYKITIFSVIDDRGNTVILPQPLTLPQTAERLQLANADVPIATLKTNDYRFESVNLNAKITGEQPLYDLNKLARHIRGMSESEMDALYDFAEHSTKLTPADCMLLKMRYPILTHGKLITAAIVSNEYLNTPRIEFVRLPTTLEEISCALETSRMAGGGYHVEVWDCRSDALKNALPERPDIHELNILAERFTSLDEMNRKCFEAMVAMQKSPPDMARLINLTYNTDECVVVADIHTPADLGAYAIENGMYGDLDELPADMLDLLDTAEVGKRLIADNGGVIVDGMYIELLVGEDYLKKPFTSILPVSELYHTMRVSLGNAPNSGDEVWLTLPSTPFCLNEANQSMGMNVLDLAPRGCHSETPELDDLFSSADSIGELNEIAERIQELRNSGGLPKLRAVVALKQVHQPSELHSLMDALDEYDYHPEVATAFDYGESEFHRLYGLDSDSPGMEHFNFESYGYDCIKRNGAVLTPHGSVRHAPIEQQLTQATEPELGEMI